MSRYKLAVQGLERSQAIPGLLHQCVANELLRTYLDGVSRYNTSLDGLIRHRAVFGALGACYTVLCGLTRLRPSKDGSGPYSTPSGRFLRLPAAVVHPQRPLPSALRGHGRIWPVAAPGSERGWTVSAPVGMGCTPPRRLWSENGS